MERQDKEITITDVAKQAGVSMATVSRVVNGNSNVKAETRKKVMAVIDKLNYHPNAVARSLASKKSTTIGVIIPNMVDLLYSNLAKGIDDVATMYKYNIILTSIQKGLSSDKQLLDGLIAKQVDGIIYMGEKVSPDLHEEMINSRIPIVFAGAIDEQNKISSVNIDYINAVKDVVGKLAEKGNEKIALVTGSLNDPVNGKYRLKGYKEALSAAHLDYDENNVFEGQYTLASGANIWKQIKARGITAAYVPNDLLGIGVLNAALDDGVKVPDDFEIVTGNNTVMCSITRPQISSVSQPLYDIGAVAMRMLTKLMNGEKLDYEAIKLPYNLIKRGTTK